MTTASALAAYGVHKAMPYLVILFGHLSYLWTSLVITNIVYATAAGLTPAYFLPGPPTWQKRKPFLQVLKRVCITSLESVCYGSSTPLEPVSQFVKAPWAMIRSFAFKQACYNVTGHGMDWTTPRPSRHAIIDGAQRREDDHLRHGQECHPVLVGSQCVVKCHACRLYFAVDERRRQLTGDFDECP